MIIAILVGAALPVTDTAFDLQCNGTQKTIQLEILKDDVAPFSQRFRIDLAARHWCAGDCSIVSQIDDVRDDAIVLEKPNTQPLAGQLFSINQFNRSTGEYTMYVRDRNGSVAVKAACKKENFSGFPKVNQKF